MGAFGPPCLHLLKLLFREASELILKHEMKWIKLPLFFGAAGLFLFSAMPALFPALGVTQYWRDSHMTQFVPISIQYPNE